MHSQVEYVHNRANLCAHPTWEFQLDHGNIPHKRQNHVEKFRAKSFGEIRKFIDESRKKWESGKAGSELPNTEAEYLALHELLLEKIEEEQSAIEHPELPEFPKRIPSPGYFRENSGRLESLYSRKDGLELDLQSAIYDQLSGNQKLIKNLEAQLSDLELEIEQREKREHEEWEKQLVEYEDADYRYRQVEDVRQRLLAGSNERQRLVDRHREIAARVLADVKRAAENKDSLPVETLYWSFLPHDMSVDSIYRYYVNRSGKGSETKLDMTRIEKIKSLEPNRVYEEKKSDDMSDYLMFTFPNTSIAIMECPIVGNALYVIETDWKNWSGKSKKTLQADQSGKITRIPHQGDWFAKVEKILAISSKKG